MATVGNMPYLVWDMMTTRSWHKTQHKPLKLSFHPQKGTYKLKNCRRKMKVSAFSKVEMSPLEFGQGVFYESGDIVYERPGTVTGRSDLPIH